MPATLRVAPSEDDKLLAIEALRFQPRSAVGLVPATDALRDDAFEPVLACEPVKRRTMADLVVIVLERGRRALQQRLQPALAVDQGQRGDIFAVDEQEVEEEEDERALAGVAGILDQIKRSPAIGEHATKLAIEVGVLGRQPGNGLGNGGVFVCPDVAPAGHDLDAASIEPGVHPITVKLDLMKPIVPVRS